MIQANDVDEVDLSNQDNALYQKLMDRSKNLPPGLNLNSPEALYKFEQLATKVLLEKQKQMKKRRKGDGDKDDGTGVSTIEPFGAKDKSIIMEES